MKEMLVGTTLGNFLLEANRWKKLRTISLSNPERATMIANDILADRLIRRICLSNCTFVDVGAHIGSVFSAVHAYDPTINIVAVEADPKKAEAIKKKFAYCKIFDLAIGESESIAEFYLDPKSGGYNSLIAKNAGHMNTIRVRVTKLDELIPDANVDVLKIDIEGAELGALRGGENLIRRNKPTIMFECVGNSVNELGYSATLLWEWFNDMDYLVLTPDRIAHNAAPLSLEVFIDAQEYPFRSHNYFAVHRDRRGEVRDRARQIIGIRAANA